MKKFLTLLITSCSLFAASKAMNSTPNDISQHPLVLAAEQGDQNLFVDKHLLLMEMEYYENDHEYDTNAIRCRALTGAIIKGHLSIIKILLDFLGENISQGEANLAFAAATACDKEETSLIMLTELFNNQKISSEIGGQGIADTFGNAFKNRYSKVIKMLMEKFGPSISSSFFFPYLYSSGL